MFGLGVAGGHEEFAAEHPFTVATEPPCGQVLMVNVASAEVVAKDAPDGGQVVEPGQKFRPFRAIGHALV